jgi:hypothetical protein
LRESWNEGKKSYLYRCCDWYSLGNSDFSLATGSTGPADAMKMGAAYLNIWMDVVRELNEAVVDCRAGSDLAERSLDAAVAFYAGSLTTQENDRGILLHALAEVLAHQMKTAGHLEDKDVGDAYVSVEIFSELMKIQSFLIGDDPELCTKAEESKNRIITLMKIPLIQGVMQYAYILEKELPEAVVSTELAQELGATIVAQVQAQAVEDIESYQAGGASFAATILPFLHACDPRLAEIIHENMKFQSKTIFRNVKNTLERSYGCLGVTCNEIGGVWDHAIGSYKDGASPCGIETESKSGSSIGSMLGVCIGVLLSGWVIFRCRHKLFAKKIRKSMPPMYNTGYIAAVSETY